MKKLALLVAGILMISQTIAAQEILFDTRIDYAVTYQPGYADTADFNGDGYADIAIAYYDTSFVGILLNDGQGRFSESALLPVRSGPRAVVGRDFDSDGDIDVICMNYRAGSMTVLSNDGAGNFAHDFTMGVGTRPSSMASGDFDQDGDWDLAFTNMNVDSLTIVLNNGDGLFNWVGRYQVGRWPISVRAADFDNDNDLDLAVACGYGRSIYIMLNRGDAVFDSAGAFDTQYEPLSLCASDIDNDGNIDLAVALNSSYYFVTLRNLGNAVFDLPEVYRNVCARAVSSADMDGNGVNDLVLVDENGFGRVLVLLNDGTGVFDSCNQYSTGDYPRNAAIADFNHDGLYDVAIPNLETNNISIFNGDGQGGLATGRHYYLPGAESVSPGDYDNDGDQDLFAFGRGDSIFIFKNDGNASYNLDTSFYLYAAYTNYQTADLNGDGYADLVGLGSSREYNIVISLGNQGGSFMSEQLYSIPSYPHDYCIADFNNDMLADLIVAYDASIMEFINSGDNSRIFSLFGQYHFNSAVDYMATGDFNGDQSLDLAIGFSGSAAVYFYYNNGDGGFIEAFSIPLDNYLRSLNVCDIDNDLDSDLIVEIIGDEGQFFTILNDGSGRFDNPVSHRYVNEYFATIINSEDINGDGSKDLLAKHRFGNSFIALLNNGHGLFSEQVVYGLDRSLQAFSCVDLNNDNFPDILSSSNIFNNISVLLNQASPQGVDFGPAPLPRTVVLSQNYPNPFNAQTIISYSLTKTGPVKLVIYNLLGQKVAVLDDGIKQPGKYDIIWNAFAYPSGVYFARIDGKESVKTIKLILLK